MTVVRKSGAKTRASRRRSKPAPGPRPPAELGVRAQRKLDKRERIRRAAWELFTTVGYERTTTKQIARRAGIASGTLFLYARDKRDLLFLVFHDRLSMTVDAQFASLPAQSPLLEQLLHVFRGLLRMYDESPALSAEFIRVIPGADGMNAHAVNGLTFAFLHRLSALIRSAQQRGEVDAAVVPGLAAQTIFSLYYSCLLAWLGRYVERAAGAEPLLREALDLHFRGLYPRHEVVRQPL